MLVVRYPLEQIDFIPWAQSTLSVERLEDLHLRADPLPFSNYVDRLKYCVEQMRVNFDVVLGSYVELIESVVAPLFGGVMHLQRPPSFRCHLAGAGTASAFHRDGDPKYGLRPGSINGWLPLTVANGNNSIYLETEQESKEFRSVSLVPGELLIFDAFHLTHGSLRNDTQSSRVSFDFRFVPRCPRRAYELGILLHEPVEQPLDLSQ